MDRPVRGLSGDVLIERIPCDTLNIMTVLGYLAHKRARCCVIDPGYVVHAANNEVCRVR